MPGNGLASGTTPDVRSSSAGLWSACAAEARAAGMEVVVPTDLSDFKLALKAAEDAEAAQQRGPPGPESTGVRKT